MTFLVVVREDHLAGVVQHAVGHGGSFKQG
jgi:hypothetical protein